MRRLRYVQLGTRPPSSDYSSQLACKTSQYPPGRGPHTSDLDRQFKVDDLKEEERHLPRLHARLNLHIFVRAGNHSHEHLSSLWVVLSFQVLINSVFNV